MWEEIFNTAVSNGIFAILFVSLLFFQLKDSSSREKKYQETVEKLSTHLDKIDEVHKEVSVIKTVLEKRGKKNETKRQSENV